MTVHPAGCDCTNYACEMRRKGVQIHAAATPTSHNRKPPAKPSNNNWEKGIAGENRPGGTRMPFLDSQGDVIGVKPMSEGKFDKAKARLDQKRRANHAATTS